MLYTTFNVLDSNGEIITSRRIVYSNDFADYKHQVSTTRFDLNTDYREAYIVEEIEIDTL